jgi:SNF2 family DNA or RNA helicase
MIAELYKHQHRIIDFNLKRLFTDGQTGAGNFVGMGGGKTRALLECVSLLQDMNEIKNTLLIAPLLVGHSVWPAEIREWGYDFNHQFVKGAPPRLNGKNLTICSPDSIHHVLTIGSQFDLLIIDESDRFKNWTALRTKNLRKLLPLIAKRIIATGTPMPNGIQDLMPQLYCVDNGEALGHNITAFRNKYMMKGGWQGRQFIERKGAERDVMEAVSQLVIRIPPSEYDVKMPPLKVTDIRVSMSAKALVAQKTLKKQLLIQLAEDRLLIAPNAASAYMKLRQLAGNFVYHENEVESFGLEKIQALSELVEEMGNEQVVIFYNFKEDKTRILAQFGVARTAALGEKGELEKWMAGKKQILICQEMSGSHGLNLQKNARYIIFYNISDSAGRHEQAMARVYRPGGLLGPVFCYILVSEGSIDEVQLPRVRGKIANQEEFLNALDQWARSN